MTRYKVKRGGWTLSPETRERIAAARRRPLEERFWEKVDRRGPDDCWPWTGAVLAAGYGSIGNGVRRSEAAHRVSWKLAHGRDIPSGQHIRHTCDNPPCVNPAHLIAGTRDDNMRDMSLRVRQSHRLTPEQVQEIRRLLREGHTQTDTARRFGVSLSTVHLIAKGKNWKHLPDEASA